MKACAINYPDVLIIEDKYQFKPPRPFAPGGEIAGVVEAVGEGVAGWSPGDRVIAMIGHGGLAEKVVVGAATAIPLPEGRSFADGSALILTYGRPSTHCSIAAGSRRARRCWCSARRAASGWRRSSSARPMARAWSPRRRRRRKRRRRARPARTRRSSTAARRSTGSGAKALSDQFKAAVGPDGAHVVYDPVGGDYTEAALRAIAWEGRYLVIGFPAGIPKLPLNLTLLKSCDVRGVFWGAFAARDPRGQCGASPDAVPAVGGGQDRPQGHAHLAAGAGGEAIAHMAARLAVGKLVVTIGES